MKSIMISIQPKWVEKISSGEKTVEVRKSRPKLETPFKCYIYKTKKRILRDITKKGDMDWFGEIAKETSICSCPDFDGGKVIGEFVCDKITALYNVATTSWDLLYGNVHEHGKNLVRKACLSEKEIHDYAKGKDCYAWHISNLKIYDKPKSLEMFPVGKIARDCGYGNYNIYNKILTRPPQSWCYVEFLGE